MQNFNDETEMMLNEFGWEYGSKPALRVIELLDRQAELFKKGLPEERQTCGKKECYCVGNNSCRSQTLTNWRNS